MKEFINKYKTLFFWLTIVSSILSLGFIILSRLFNENIVYKFISDISVIITFSITLTLNFNLNITIRELKENETIKENDKHNYEIIRNTYNPLATIFARRDFSMSYPIGLFDSLFKVLDYEQTRPDFRFSNNKVNSKLKELVSESDNFVKYLLDHTHDYGDTLKVSKRKLLSNKGEPPKVFNEFKNEEEMMDKLFDNVLKKYKEFMDIYYKKYSPHSTLN